MGQLKVAYITATPIPSAQTQSLGPTETPGGWQRNRVDLCAWEGEAK